MNKVSMILVAVLGLLVGGLVGSYFMSSVIDSKSQENKQVVRYKSGYAGGEVPEIWNTALAGEPTMGESWGEGYFTDESKDFKRALLWLASPEVSTNKSSIYSSELAEYESLYDPIVQKKTTYGLCLPKYGSCGVPLISINAMDSKDMESSIAILKSNSGYKHSTTKTEFQTFDRFEMVDKEQPFGDDCTYYTKSKNGKIGLSIYIANCIMKNPYTKAPNTESPIDHFINTFDVSRAPLPETVSGF